MPLPDKKILRKEIKARLAAVPVELLAAAGLETARRLAGGTRGKLPGWELFRSVLVFVSLPGEIDTAPLMEAVLRQKKKLFAPRLIEAPGPDSAKDLAFYRVLSARGPWQAGPFGVREPPAKEDLRLGPGDFPFLALVPGLAFDRRGCRLGRGGGCYDRFFNGLDSGMGKFSAPPGGGGHFYASCGLCLELQLAGAVPAESHDKKMDMILTERGITLCSREDIVKRLQEPATEA
ncbi:MAG: 5-formyltetrahydrofolate cyclo-ligase [Spirochaetaceae bacterium]|jgi:5-formyltetrahydrofolate cyclo-ligase|nr:5-formyltetrahydrofolate cyclo-ligase [Spirochaetaceae bacterium]